MKVFNRLGFSMVVILFAVSAANISYGALAKSTAISDRNAVSVTQLSRTVQQNVPLKSSEIQKSLQTTTTTESTTPPTESVTLYWSISPLNLIPKDETINYNKTVGHLEATDGTFYAPLYLPEGARITRLSASFYDPDQTPATFIEVYLYRENNLNAQTEWMSYITSSTISESYGYQEISNTVSPSVEVVDNNAYSYFVRATFIASSANGLRLGPIKIQYSIDNQAP